jgi:hypothetical protein
MVDDDAEQRRQKRELREKYDRLKAQVETMRLRLGRTARNG